MKKYLIFRIFLEFATAKGFFFCGTGDGTQGPGHGARQILYH
jgi:hypothetical protein